MTTESTTTKSLPDEKHDVSGASYQYFLPEFDPILVQPCKDSTLDQFADSFTSSYNPSKHYSFYQSFDQLQRKQLQDTVRTPLVDPIVDEGKTGCCDKLKHCCTML